jgi:hypothetical protein
MAAGAVGALNGSGARNEAAGTAARVAESRAAVSGGIGQWRSGLSGGEERGRVASPDLDVVWSATLLPEKTEGMFTVW